jgi:hypothetical protein
MTKIETLRMIIAKSPSQAAEAGKAIMAINKKSPWADMRCNHVAIGALEDPAADFTDEERSAIADLMSEEETETRDYILRVRLTNSERLELEEKTTDKGLSISEYVRQKLFD